MDFHSKIDLVYVDHYDSFSHNVVDWLESAGFSANFVYFDDLPTLEKFADSSMPFVLSPGPLSPADLPGSVQFINRVRKRAPILGICLGHQLLAASVGARCVRGAQPSHGQTRQVHWLARSGIFSGAPEVSSAVVYNSLCIERDSIHQERVVAVDSIGEIQAIYLPPNATDYPALGLQFHPESFASERNEFILDVWKELCRRRH